MKCHWAGTSKQQNVSRRRTRLSGPSWPWIFTHTPDSFEHLLKGAITVRLELAHRAVVGVDRDLLFVLDLEQG